MAKKKSYEYRESNKSYRENDGLKQRRLKNENRWRYNPNQSYSQEEDEDDVEFDDVDDDDYNYADQYRQGG